MSVDLYTSHFGFSERPFKILPDPDFLYWSRDHKLAYAILEYGIVTRAPLTVVTGEVGTGKTTLVQVLLGQIEQDVTVGLISNAQGGRGDLLRWLLSAFDIKTDGASDYVTLFNQFQDFVISEYAEGRHVVIIIDEAQNLEPETLEELRMLTNINSNKDELLQLILLGQPELREMISRPELRQFSQRVSATYHIDPMNFATTKAYIHHRLLHVGGTGKEITEPAIKSIHESARGIPRMINKLCDLGLVYAASAGRDQVDIRTMRELNRDGIILPIREPTLVLTNPWDPAKESAS